MIHMAYINKELVYGNRLSSIIANSFSILHIRYAPFGLLKRNCERIFEQDIEWLEEHRDQSSGRERATYIRMLKRLDTMRESFQATKNRKEFMKRYYNFILALDGNGLLHGFHIGTTNMNAELASIYAIKPYEKKRKKGSETMIYLQVSITIPFMFDAVRDISTISKWEGEVTIACQESELVDERVMPFSDFSSLIQQLIVTQYEGKNLGDLFDISTCEALALQIFYDIRKCLLISERKNLLSLESVRLSENKGNYCTIQFKK